MIFVILWPSWLKPCSMCCLWLVGQLFAHRRSLIHCWHTGTESWSMIKTTCSGLNLLWLIPFLRVTVDCATCETLDGWWPDFPLKLKKNSAEFWNGGHAVEFCTLSKSITYVIICFSTAVPGLPQNWQNIFFLCCQMQLFFLKTQCLNLLIPLSISREELVRYVTVAADLKSRIKRQQKNISLCFSWNAHSWTALKHSFLSPPNTFSSLFNKPVCSHQLLSAVFARVCLFVIRYKRSCPKKRCQLAP